MLPSTGRMRRQRESVNAPAQDVERKGASVAADQPAANAAVATKVLGRGGRDVSHEMSSLANHPAHVCMKVHSNAGTGQGDREGSPCQAENVRIHGLPKGAVGGGWPRALHLVVDLSAHCLGLIHGLL